MLSIVLYPILSYKKEPWWWIQRDTNTEPDT